MSIYETDWLMSPPEDFSKIIEYCIASKSDISRELMYLANSNITETKLHKIGKLVKSINETLISSNKLSHLKELRLLVISNSNIDLLELPLVGAACRYGINLEVIPISLSRGLNDLLSEKSIILDKKIDYTLIFFDYRSFIDPVRSINEDADQWVELVIHNLMSMKKVVEERFNCVTILANLVDPLESPFGNYDLRIKGSLRSSIENINSKLLENISDNTLFLDINRFATSVGLKNWYDERQWHYGKIPFSPKLIPTFIDQILRLISSNIGKSKKCLVLDFDNTLWGGVIGDDGIGGVQLGNGSPSGEAFLEFHRYILSLRSRGIIIAGCSKNDLNIALDMLNNHPDSLIRESHFSSIVCNWNDKVGNLKVIAEELNIGLDSLVFFDDNPFERNLVRKFLPEVAVLEVPNDPTLYKSLLDESGFFEPVGYSDEDRFRNEFYQKNKKTFAIKDKVDLEAYLVSLGMVLEYERFNSINRTRITQLINKTNQFNLTTKRYTQAEIEKIEENKDNFGFSFRLKDNYGDNGIIAIVICLPLNEDEVIIDTFLMSCRVFNRTVEQAVLNFIASYLKAKSFQKLIGIYIETKKNNIVKNLYCDYGFLSEDNSQTWMLDLNKFSEKETQVTIRPASK